MGGRAVEGTGLENRQACKRLVGSNPTPSAISNRCPPALAMVVLQMNQQVASWVTGKIRPAIEADGASLVNPDTRPVTRNCQAATLPANKPFPGA